MKHWAGLILLALLWAPSFFIIKIGLEDIPPLSLAAWRVALAAIVLYPLMLLGGSRFPRNTEFWKKFAIMGFLANALPFSLLMIGETYTDSALAAIVNGFTPIGTAILAHYFIDDEKLSAMTIIGVVIGFAGIALLFLPTLTSELGDDGTLIGLLAFLAMAISYSLSIIYSRRSLRGYPRLVGPTAQLIMSSLMLLPISFAFEWDRIVMPSTNPLLALLWLAIVATALAYIVYYRLLEIAGATFLSLVTFLLPPLGAFLSVLFLEESLAWSAIAGCGLILLGAGFVRNTHRDEATVD